MNREKTTQIMFETFSVPAFYLVDAPSMALRQRNENNGLVVDIGDSDCQIVPVIDGVPLLRAAQKFGTSGRDITEYFMKLISENEQHGVKLVTTAERDNIAQRLKVTVAFFLLHDLYENRSLQPFCQERTAYVARDFHNELDLMRFGASPARVEVPIDDNTTKTIYLDFERFQCMEAV